MLSPNQKFKTSYYSILDVLTVELIKKKEVYSKLKEKFGFLFSTTTVSNVELRIAASNLQRYFYGDLQETFIDEIVQFFGYLKKFSLRKLFTPSDFQTYQHILEL